MTVPNVEEFGELGVISITAMEAYGSYLSWTDRSIVVNAEFGT